MKINFAKFNSFLILFVLFSGFIVAQEKPKRDYAAEQSAKLEPNRKIQYKSEQFLS